MASDEEGSFYAGYLSLISFQTDLIHDPVVIKDNAGALELSPIQVVVGGAPIFKRYRALKSWPTTIQEMSELSEEIKSDMDAEWTAALLLAAGANPWELKNDTHPSRSNHSTQLHPVSGMAVRGWAGVVKNALEHPDCPDLEQVAQLRVKNTIPMAESMGRVVSLRAYLLAQGQNEVLGVLFDKGMVLPKDKTSLVEELSNIHEETVALLAEKGLFNSLSPAVIKKVQSAWVLRVRNKTLSPEQLPEMMSLLLPKDASQSQLEAASAAQIDGILGVPWNDNRHSNQVMNVGIEELNKQVPSKSQHRGQWSVLGAYAMAQIRRTGQDSSQSVPKWDIAPMIEANFVRGKGWVYADLNDPSVKGSLAPAIDVQWRAGITMSAPILMAELGKNNYSYTKEKKPLPSLSALCLACGVSDPDAWIAQNANAMAEFTQAISRPNARTQHAVLSMVWSNILESPHADIIVQSMSKSNAVGLALAITGNFMSSSSWPLVSVQSQGEAVTRFKNILRKFFPSMNLLGGTGVQAYRKLVQDGEHDSPLAQAIVVDALALSTPKQVQELIGIMGPALSPKSPVLKIVKLWMASRKNDPVFDAATSAARAAILTQMASEVRGKSTPPASAAKENRPKI